MDNNIRRWTRTVIPGTASLVLLMACALILVPNWRPLINTTLSSGQGTLGWAGLGLVAATFVGYVQSHIYFGFGWEWMTIPYERFPGVEQLGLERTRSQSWAMLSPRWQSHAQCIGGFASINARLEGLGDALHGLGGVLAGAALSALGLVALALLVEPRPDSCRILLAVLVWGVWVLGFVRAYVTLRARFEYYSRNNFAQVQEHEGSGCKGRTETQDKAQAARDRGEEKPEPGSSSE